MGECLLCKMECSVGRTENGLSFYRCKNCGSFYTTIMAEMGLKADDKFKVSSYVKESSLLNKSLPIIVKTKSSEIDSKLGYQITVDEVIKEKFPKDIPDILDKSLLNISKIQGKDFEKWIEIKKNNYMNWNLFYSDTWEKIQYILNILIRKGLIEPYISKDDIKDNLYSSPSRIDCDKFRLSYEGWSKIYDIERKSNDSKQVFVAMWFDESMNEVWEKGFKSAIEEAGYNPIRIDKKEHNEKICDAIIAEIRKSKFLIADFTGNRGGVYFEAGFAKGLNKEVIFTVNEKEKNNLHFDTRQYNHIIWKSYEDLKKNLNDRIIATII